MMVMTAKVDKKKLLWIAAAVVAAIVMLFALLGGDSQAADTSAPLAAGNDARVDFLKSFGWEVAASPVESNQVRIPEEASAVYQRYNKLQQSQGFDLTDYAGKQVMRFVYKVNNYPGATEPVYATVLIYKNRVIGGDITDTAAGGKIQGFQRSPEGTSSTEAT